MYFFGSPFIFIIGSGSDVILKTGFVTLAVAPASFSPKLDCISIEQGRLSRDFAMTCTAMTPPPKKNVPLQDLADKVVLDFQ